MLGWFPDYPDTDDYLSPFLVDGGFFQNGYTTRRPTSSSPRSRRTDDQAEREEIFGQLQDIAAEDVPFIPSGSARTSASTAPGMEGVEDTLDPAFIFRFWLRQQERLTTEHCGGHAVVGQSSRGDGLHSPSRAARGERCS